MSDVFRDLQEAFDEGFEAVKEYIDAELQDLGSRISAIEAHSLPKYVGVHEDGRQYDVGNFVTHGGALWHCNTQTRQRPGSSADWTLAVKSGRS